MTSIASLNRFKSPPVNYKSDAGEVHRKLSDTTNLTTVDVRDIKNTVTVGYFNKLSTASLINAKDFFREVASHSGHEADSQC